MIILSSVGAQHATPCAARRIGEQGMGVREMVRNIASPVGREGVACCAPTKTMNVVEDGREGNHHYLALRGSRRGAACYALRRKAHRGM